MTIWRKKETADSTVWHCNPACRWWPTEGYGATGAAPSPAQRCKWCVAAIAIDPPPKAEDLLPCPFNCNGRDSLIVVESAGYMSTRVRCRLCGAMGPVGGPKEEAAALWNNRKTETNDGTG